MISLRITTEMLIKCVKIVVLKRETKTTEDHMKKNRNSNYNSMAHLGS